MPAAADRNLLFGILAVQMDFITRDQLVAAMHAWILDKQKPLAALLVDQKALTPDTRALLDALVEKHLALHDNDAQKSLAAVSSVGSVKQDLADIADADVQASLMQLAPSRSRLPGGTSGGSARRAGPTDPYATTGAVGAPSGLRFRILRPHAAGGLGEVFAARDEELHREVALKQIRERHADDAEARSRFLLEAEITGGLEHPGIVPVYGLGTYGDGRPFYAMRFIKGDNLKEAIARFHQSRDRQGGVRSPLPHGRGSDFASIEFRQLLGRFIDVCNAVAYAHSRGVLHRDLKPGNVMLGSFGETLVVDWGLAKCVGRTEPRNGPGDTTEEALVPASGSGSAETLVGTAVGTPAYMSPEQAAGKLDQLGPATDVYSLGATLYTLLTNRPPVEGKETAEVLRKVQRGDSGFHQPDASARVIPHPLVAVCKKAMSLNPRDRYGTPLTLAEDLEHWLADEPVSAWREPWTVRTRRWVRHHQNLVTSSAASLFIALVALTVGLLWYQDQQNRRANEEAERERERKTAREESAAVKEYLSALFASADPSGLQSIGFVSGPQQGLKLTAPKLLDIGATHARTKLQAQPLLRAAMLDQIGNVYRSLGFYEKAEPLIGEGLSLRQEHHANDDEIASSLHHLATLQYERGRFPEAEELYRTALKLREKQRGREDLETANTMFNLAWTLGMQFGKADRARLAEAESLIQATVDVRRKKLGKEDREVGIALLGQAAIIYEKDNIKGIFLAHQAFSILAKSRNKDPATSALVDYFIAVDLRKKGGNDNLRRAATIQKRVMTQVVELLGDRHPLYALLLGDLAGLLREAGDLDGATKAINQALDIGRFHGGHPVMVPALVELADAQRQDGNLKQAESLYRESLGIALRFDAPRLAPLPGSRLTELLRSQHRQQEADELIKTLP
jgi:serine/threonine protein kinase